MKILKNELVFDQSQVPFSFCHGSSICALSDDKLIVAWFAGNSGEGGSDTSIWLAHYDDGVWGTPIEISNESTEPHWNPVLFQYHDGTIMLFYKVGFEICKWHTKIKFSYDNGNTWTDSVDLVKDEKGGRGPVRNNPVELSDGSIIAGASTEGRIWSAFADRSIDGGYTWQKGNNLTIDDLEYSGGRTIENSNIEVSEQSFYGRGVIQPAIWESGNGHVHMLLRSTEGYIYRSDSLDFGKTWSSLYPTTLPNNNSGIDVMQLTENKILVCYNPVGKNWGIRTPLTLITSNNNGVTWKKEMDIEVGEGEYSYPSISKYGDKIYISYTVNRIHIKVLSLKL